METRWLQTFTLAARTGSNSAAAERLGVARSTVTGHIQGLERALGARLFDRNLPGSPLTRSGAALLEHAETILDDMERARLAVARAAGSGDPAALHLGATPSVCAYQLPSFVKMMNRFLPELSLEIETATPGRLREQVLSGGTSVVLVNRTKEPWRAGNDGDDPVHSRVLWEEDALLVGTRDAAARPRRVLLTGRDCVYRELTETDVLERLPDAEPMQVGSLEGVKSAVLAGLGVGLLPEVAVRPWLAKGHLVEMPLETGHVVVTEVLWNRRTCPAGVSAHLRRLRPAPSRRGTPTLQAV
ncbi:LysR family transcriptional regulator [Kitasatospora sp. NA04385]|uniref:LysR family transcriptional regulator n=1 Tax=Kitasatospora sp. NA04385 TaxID=2742135 RepID=UPI0015914950|nr:LysR family transcriptional regulator [Kitasatospora sp. NA04385]QKW21206.1 LysR family transcriptional regulator [Kitasatospora sp. NA04385]